MFLFLLFLLSKTNKFFIQRVSFAKSALIFLQPKTNGKMSFFKSLESLS